MNDKEDEKVEDFMEKLDQYINAAMMEHTDSCVEYALMRKGARDDLQEALKKILNEQ